MNLHGVDLNLLLVLHHLLQARNVSAAAAALGLTQPAVSNALKRLRVQLNDELFVRTAKGMEPTPFAMQLAAPVAQALHALQEAIGQRDTFDAATSTRTFTLAITDIGEIYFIPRLIEVLAQKAPNIKITTVRNSATEFRQGMEAGGVDLAIGLLPQLQAGFMQRRLFTQRYVALFRRGHPIATNPISLEALSTLDHVGIVAANTGHGELEALLAKHGLVRRIRLLVPHFVAVGHILQSTDLLAIVPERFAQRCELPFGLQVSPLPVDLPEISIHLLWRTRLNKEPGNKWLRGVIGELFGQAGTIVV
jgi:DNA-binding transcriptional LysR family regulator